MALISAILICLLVGWFAQSKKGRTGVVWFLISGIFFVFAMVFLVVVDTLGNPGVDYSTGTRWVTVVVLADILTFFVMLIVVATLPKKNDGSN